MHCRRVRDDLVQFIQGTLDDELAQAVAAHLIGCEACADEADAIREILTHAGQGFAADPIVLADGYLGSAALARASALHFQPGPDACRVRRRVDGALEDVDALKSEVGRRVVNRIKLLAGLRLAARGLAQTAHLRWQTEGQEYDLHLSTMPTSHGDSLVVRMRRPGGALLGLNELGLSPDTLAACEAWFADEGGLVIVAAPPGSGRTTTLYALLQRVQDPTRHIVTLESPIEAPLDGVTQMPAIAETRISFAAAVRASLEHDPDVILCGDLPDGETARACLEAAASGKLVLAGMAAESVADALGRLLDLGVEKFLLTSGLRGIIAQRLVRTLCPDCRRLTPATDAEREWLEARVGPLAEGTLLGRAVGCDRCRGKGYRGRTAVSEALSVSNTPLAAILGHANADEVVREADNSVRSLSVHAAERVLNGETTIEEAARVT